MWLVSRLILPDRILRGLARPPFPGIPWALAVGWVGIVDWVSIIDWAGIVDLWAGIGNPAREDVTNSKSESSVWSGCVWNTPSLALVGMRKTFTWCLARFAGNIDAVDCCP